MDFVAKYLQNRFSSFKKFIFGEQSFLEKETNSIWTEQRPEGKEGRFECLNRMQGVCVSPLRVHVEWRCHNG